MVREELLSGCTEGELHFRRSVTFISINSMKMSGIEGLYLINVHAHVLVRVFLEIEILWLN